MVLVLRQTVASPAYADRADWTVVEDGRPVGRIYEDRHAAPDLKWVWSVTVYVHPMRKIVTAGNAPTLDEAKAAFRTSWERVKTET